MSAPYFVGDIETTAIVEGSPAGVVRYRGVPAFTEEDALLFAAAPEMLEALKMFNLTEESIVAGTATTITLTIPFDFISKAAAAVRKAEGR